MRGLRHGAAIPEAIAWSCDVQRLGTARLMLADAYKFYVTRAKKAVDSGRFPQDTLDRMDKEMDETLPTLKLFGPSGPMREDLREILCAWVVYRSDSALGYVSGLHVTCGSRCLSLLPTPSASTDTPHVSHNRPSLTPPGPIHLAPRRDVPPRLPRLPGLHLTLQPPPPALPSRLLHRHERRDRRVLPGLREPPGGHVPQDLRELQEPWAEIAGELLQESAGGTGAL